jgi:hypothetical protein
MVGEMEFDSWYEQRFFSPLHILWDAHISLSIIHSGLFPWYEVEWLEDDTSSALRVENMNLWSYMSASPCVFIACFLVRNKGTIVLFYKRSNSVKAWDKEP